MNNSFQSIVSKLNSFWQMQGCVLLSPIDIEVGAGTSHAHTFFKCLDGEHCSLAYIQPSRRPKDSRFGEDCCRLQQHFQYQVIIKPAPENLLMIYFNSLKSIGFKMRSTNVRLQEDEWRNSTLGAYGVGWEVQVNGLEVTQITVFRRMGGLVCCPTPGEITYGLERIVAQLQKVHHVLNISLANGVVRASYRDFYYHNETEQSVYNLNYRNNSFLKLLFKIYNAEATNLVGCGFIIPSYELILKMCATLNILEARACLSYRERALCSSLIRGLANKVALSFRFKLRSNECPSLILRAV